MDKLDFIILLFWCSGGYFSPLTGKKFVATHATSITWPVLMELKVRDFTFKGITTFLGHI